MTFMNNITFMITQKAVGLIFIDKLIYECRNSGVRVGNETCRTKYFTFQVFLQSHE